MRYKRKYTLYPVRYPNGTKIWYFRIYLPNGQRRAKSTGCSSKERARMYVDNLLDDESSIRRVFESNLIISIKGSDALIYAPQSTPKSSITFEEFVSPWWSWDTCPYVLARRDAGTEKHPGIKQSYVKSCYLWTKNYLIPYFGKYKLTDINVDMINMFWQVLKDKHNLAPKIINNIGSVFIVMMKDAVKKELIERNPVEMTIARTVDKKKQELLTDEECAKLFDIDRIKELWNDRIVYYVYSLVAGLTGLRAGELLALTISEVKHNKIIVKRSYNESYGMSTTKTSEEREVPITNDI